MKKSLRTAVLLLVILVPFVLLAGLGLKTAKDDTALEQVRFDALLGTTLDGADAVVQRVLSAREQHLAEITRIENPTPETLRGLLMDEPAVRQFFLMDKEGRLTFPRDDASASENERLFLKRASGIFTGGERFVRDLDSPTGTQNRGFYVWYIEEGASLIFWQQLKTGKIIGAELSRASLLSDIIAVLPDELPRGINTDTAAIQLQDESGRPMFGVGRYEPAQGETPRVRRALSDPLGALTLGFYVSQTGAPTASGTFQRTLFAGIGALFVLLLVGTIYYLRETGRDLKEAQRRVTFVNQVSHELKTPLTNIRMYAELLEMRLEGTDSEASEHLDVIVQESHRLSRLIANVLTFGRGMRGKLEIHPSPSIVNDIVEETVRQFEPALALRDIAVEVETDAPERVLVDSDAVAQILGNLLSNVEKYAATGKHVRVTSRFENDRTILTVADRGPGIPASSRMRIFTPFYRVSGAVTDGVTGTGIGLSIARDLAKLHGGDLTILPSDKGVCFQVVLKTKLAL